MDNRNSHSWAVVGFDFYAAKDILEEIEQSCGKTIIRKFIGNYKMRTEFTDGTILRWFPEKRFRGARCGKMWCDKNIDQEFLKCVILPYYIGKYEDIIWI